MKQIICEFGTAKEIPNFDSCLCTHIAVPVSLESEKDDDIPGKYYCCDFHVFSNNFSYTVL